MRRKQGALVPLEEAICASAAALKRNGIADFHGYELARHMADDADRKLLTAYGTLYRALARLEGMGLLESRREDPEISARENRPARRLYTLTGLGERAAHDAVERAPMPAGRRPRRRVAPA